MPVDPQSESGARKGNEPASAVGDGKAGPLDPQSYAQLLLREFTHRLNNELASAISMIAIAASRSTTRPAKEVLIEVHDRLHAYAQVNNFLQTPEHVTPVDVAAYLNQLCQAISRSRLDLREIDLLLFVERPLLMSCDRCWRLGLIVSELITNSARHAFSDGGGSIRVELVPLLTDVECRVMDNGKSNGKNSAGIGRGRLIIEGLVRSLSGNITQRFEHYGSTSVVRFPLKLDAFGE